jgi:2'-5' RNA ligase
MNKKKRAIIIFPQFGSDTNLIQDIRNQYDPLANKIAPHITLVFPFESDISSKRYLSKYSVVRCCDRRIKLPLIFDIW